MSCFGPLIIYYWSNNFQDVTTMFISGDPGAMVVNFHYVANINLNLSGTSNTVYCKNKYCFSCKFGLNSIVYDRRSALRGKLKKVFIKKTSTHMTNRDCAYSGSGRICMYFDTLNEVYDDDSLISTQEAIDLAREYYENQISICTIT